eukprot:GFYU01013386.1.p1 GENE.GFYU01013386.1~~GFYU01013386.1.p1  ORF type:complete len:538 (-),score=119.80 GFYU01013386.1:67-1680(-)
MNVAARQAAFVVKGCTVPHMHFRSRVGGNICRAYCTHRATTTTSKFFATSLLCTNRNSSITTNSVHSRSFRLVSQLPSQLVPSSNGPAMTRIGRARTLMAPLAITTSLLAAAGATDDIRSIRFPQSMAPFSTSRLEPNTCATPTPTPFVSLGLFGVSTKGEKSLAPPDGKKGQPGKVGSYGVYWTAYPANVPCEDGLHVALQQPEKKGDQWLYASVFDGHGGREVADWCTKFLHKTFMNNVDARKMSVQDALVAAFETVDAQLKAAVTPLWSEGNSRAIQIGACANVAVVSSTSIIVANSGDCRAIMAVDTAPASTDGTTPAPSKSWSSWLFGGGGDGSEGQTYPPGQLEAVALSNDHNCREPVEEEKLKREHPGEKDIIKYIQGKPVYVKHRLQPTRCFGDFYLKDKYYNNWPTQDFSEPFTPPYIRVSPEITTHALTGRERFVVMGSDGLYDILSNQEIVDAVNRYPSTEESKQMDVATYLREYALEYLGKSYGRDGAAIKEIPPHRRRRVHDDITICVVYLNDNKAPAQIQAKL